MNKLPLWLALFLILLVSGCALFDRFLTHQAQPVIKSVADSPVHLRTFADLRGDGGDLMITSSMWKDGICANIISKLDGKAVSQINSGDRIRHANVLEDSLRSSLFLSFNDQHKLWLFEANYAWGDTVKRDNRLYEPIDRVLSFDENASIEWEAIIVPDIMGDIDADGSPELVCRAYDGFTANPRGIIVYDYTTRKIEWKYILPTNVKSMLFDDFDGDGQREFICSTVALKNTTSIFNDMDDASCWLFVINPKGERVFLQKIFDGYGELTLEADEDSSGKYKEIYMRKTTWGAAEIPNGVSVLRWNGSGMVTLREWTVFKSLERGGHSFLHKLKSNEPKQLLLVDKTSRLILLDEQLREQKHSYTGSVRVIWDVADLDLDGDSEIILETNDKKYEILDSDLRVRARFASPFESDERVSVSIVQKGYGEHKLIAMYLPTKIVFMDYTSVAPLTLLARGYKAAALPLSLLFLAGCLLFVFHNRRRCKLFITTANSIEQGVIIMRGKDRIHLYNRYVQELLSEGLPPNLEQRHKSLKQCLPAISETLRRFCLVKTDSQDSVMNLGAKLIPHKVMIYNLHGLRLRYLITLLPQFTDSDIIQEKLAWADTARRLSHNVRRHITNVLWALNPLQNDEDLSDGGRDNIGTIRREVEKIRVFTHAFQRFTEMRDNELETQDIIPSVEHCISRINLPGNIHLIKDWSLNSIATLFEPIRFEEALGNLIHNAVDAMPQGGTLHITVRHFPLHESPKGPLTVLVEVGDSGKGIPAKYMEEVWQAFFTTKDSGTGIGLPESRKIIRSMGGDITLESHEGEGTVVSIWLREGDK